MEGEKISVVGRMEGGIGRFGGIVGKGGNWVVQSLVDSLSWKNIAMDCQATMLVLTHDDPLEKKLVAIGKAATLPLIAALEDESKTVIAHIILTQIWATGTAKYTFGSMGIRADCKDWIGTHHVYNGLVWEYLSEDHKDHVRPAEIQKIKAYWKAKAIDHLSTPNFDMDIVFKELEHSDQLIPCEAVYHNDSRLVKGGELVNLLNKSVRDTLFQQLCGKLGNDSTMSCYTNDFSVNYRLEHLTFYFGKDSLLEELYLGDGYEGELPHGVKVTDTRAMVEEKLGKPDKEIKNDYNIYYQYDREKMFFHFMGQKVLDIGFTASFSKP